MVKYNTVFVNKKLRRIDIGDIKIYMWMSPSGSRRRSAKLAYVVGSNPTIHSK